MTTQTKPSLRTRLTPKQEAFAYLLFQDVSQREAWIKAGYSSNYSMAVLDVNASRLANQTKVQLRIKELRDAVTKDGIANVEERQKRLTEFIRADLVDFITPDGIKVDKQSPNVGAVAEITTKTRVFRKGGEPVNITTLKLRDPIAAIDLLNKMEHCYQEQPGVNIDNRQVNIYVTSEKTKELLGRVKERTGKLIEEAKID